MTPASIEDTLATAEQSVGEGWGLAGTGFWTAVGAVKRDPELVDRYADRIAAIDQRAFASWALLSIPLNLGTTLAVLATVAGLVLIGAAYSLDDLVAVIVFYAGFGVLVATSHGLGHLVVGGLLGIRFTAWFVGSLKRPQPGVKVDYASYLRASAPRRAWMHASGALVTKLLPFVLLGAAIASGLPTWAVWGLVVIGAGSILTDVLWSTRSSDWKRFRREMTFAS